MAFKTWNVTSTILQIIIQFHRHLIILYEQMISYPAGQKIPCFL